MRARTEARFAVGTRAGPRSSIWKVWIQGDEAYMASRLFGKYNKISFHSSGECQWSCTGDWVIAAENRKNADRHIVRWHRADTVSNVATPIFKVQIPWAELREMPAPTDKKKVFWIGGTPPGSTVCLTLYFTDSFKQEPSPSVSDQRRKLFGLQLRSGRWVVALADLVSLSQEDLMHARHAVRNQFYPSATDEDLQNVRATLFSQPPLTAVDCYGFIELCLLDSAHSAPR